MTAFKDFKGYTYEFGSKGPAGTLRVFVDPRPDHVYVEFRAYEGDPMSKPYNCSEKMNSVFRLNRGELAKLAKYLDEGTDEEDKLCPTCGQPRK